MRRLWLLAVLVFCRSYAAGRSESKGLQAKLNTNVARYDLKANGSADDVLKTAKQFQLPIGIEWVKDKQALRGLNRTWKGDTVQDILGSIMKEYPGYAFRVEHGVVHVFRRDLVSDRHNFLNLRVPDYFEVRQQVGGLANEQLQDAVQNIVSPRNLPPGAGKGFEYATGIDERPLSIALRGLTVREALNALVEVSEHKIWVVTFSDDVALTPTGFRRTETLWHPTPFPDNQQPMWEFLAWQEYMPQPVTTVPQSPR